MPLCSSDDNLLALKDDKEEMANLPRYQQICRPICVHFSSIGLVKVMGNVFVVMFEHLEGEGKVHGVGSG
jgi:hypothetical protein